eukprot:NODE_9761_length_627_cov_89.666667_g9493_i0.p1 GENE.NODE_9761_length_627_cov_89.666667_g9493_i0~~NODE_9761_length_627_cov_89.666667_g9493_i0.p1  ORF type:complete len:187 (-),score=18.12 NODE_9761_length_627_cov_89.666667_g9493_i0:67-570(-)
MSSDIGDDDDGDGVSVPSTGEPKGHVHQSSGAPRSSSPEGTSPESHSASEPKLPTMPDNPFLWALPDQESELTISASASTSSEIHQTPRKERNSLAPDTVFAAIPSHYLDVIREDLHEEAHDYRDWGHRVRKTRQKEKVRRKKGIVCLVTALLAIVIVLVVVVLATV